MLIQFWQSFVNFVIGFCISPDNYFHQTYWYNWYLSALLKLYEVHTYQISVQLGYVLKDVTITKRQTLSKVECALKKIIDRHLVHGALQSD
jgi:hypothetical protein